MLQHRLSDSLDAGIGYRMIYIPRKNATDRISHSPQITLNWRL